MKSVATWEERQLVKKAALFLVIMTICVTLFWDAAAKLWQEMSDLGLWDLLTALSDDFDSARTSFIQNLLLIWEFISKGLLAVVAITSTVSIVVLVLNANEARHLPRKISSLRKYLFQKGGDINAT